MNVRKGQLVIATCKLVHACVCVPAAPHSVDSGRKVGPVGQVRLSPLLPPPHPAAEQRKKKPPRHKFNLVFLFVVFTSSPVSSQVESNENLLGKSDAALRREQQQQ